MAQKPYIIDHQQRELRQRSYLAAPVLGKKYPGVKEVIVELRFTDPDNKLHPSPHNPLGAKGAGEGGMIPVGGVVANAIAAALAPLGVVPRDLPLSPPRVWELIAAAKRAGRDG